MSKEKYEPTQEGAEGEANLDQATLDQITASFKATYDSNEKEFIYSFEVRGHKVTGIANAFYKDNISFTVDGVWVEDKVQAEALFKKYGTTIRALIDAQEKDKETHKDDPIKDLLK